MSKFSNILLVSTVLAGFGSPVFAARTEPGALPKESAASNSALDRLDDATIEALAICPECKRRFLRDHRWTDTQYAELLETRAKAGPGESKSTTGQ